MEARRTNASKRLALVAWTGVALVITVVQAAYAGKWLTWNEVIALGVFLTAAVLALIEGWFQNLRGLLQKPLPRAPTFVVLAILGLLMLMPLLRFD